ncbi:MAG: hypothetical protein A3F16_00585 [Deltaproteobacteria bacterium RIFCSPHIGHO2_12_FULL_43_9]|nr:MAG: hypothetical protein A3F16_00585 [Deltaproteobacteria bacterium RIFCSPHIGHO2_12_FULL_43_9]
MSEGLKSRLDRTFIEAQKVKDTLRVSVLRMIKAEIKNREIDKKQVKLTEDEMVQVINSAIKRHRESVEMFQKGGRKDLVDKETKEIAILLEFLPEQLSESKVREIVRSAIKSLNASSIKDLGNVMKEVIKETKGKAEGKLVSQLVKEELERLKS